jgi:hypothetical protein
MSHDQSATAFHFLISNFFVGAVADDAAADAASAMVCTSILCGALFKKRNNVHQSLEMKRQEVLKFERDRIRRARLRSGVCSRAI